MSAADRADAMLAEAARQRQATAPLGRMVDGMFVAKGLFTLGASLIIAVLGPFALSWSADIAAKSNAVIPGFALPFVQRPWLLAVVALPSIACGVMLMITKRHRWIAVTISTLIMLLVLLIVVAVFATGLSSMYGDAMKPL